MSPPAIPRWRRSCAVMRGEGLLLAMVAAAAFATGCGGPCAGREDAAFEAAWRDDLQTMRRLIAQNPGAARAGQCDPPQTAIGRFVAQFRWTGSSTVLHVAARQGHADFAALLLEAGADVDARNEEGAMPLHLAAQYGHDEVARVLLAANATVDGPSICVTGGDHRSLDAAGEDAIGGNASFCMKGI